MSGAGSDDAPIANFGPDAWGGVLGLEILEAGPERVRARVEIGPRHHQPYGIVHGGVYTSIVEGVASHGAGLAVRARGAGPGLVVGVHNATDFLRSHGQGELVALGEPVHQSRTQEIWQVVIRRSSDGKPVARGQVRFQLLEQHPEERRAAAPSPSRSGSR